MNLRWILVALACCTSGVSSAAQLGLLNFSGFYKDEWSVGTNQATPTQPCYGDSRGVLGFPGCGASTETVGSASHATPMFQLSMSAAHEFDSGIKVDGVLTQRWRNGGVDIVGQPFYEKNIGVDVPGRGTLRVGTQLARAWSRQDAFSYPIGLSSAWSESGAGYSILPQSVRYTAPSFALGRGKLTLEATYATDHAFSGYYNTGIANRAPKPRLLELFAQYSDAKNLIELTFDDSHGAGQSSWGKNPLTGAADVPLLTSPTNVYSAEPRQTMAVIEGDHWFSPQWMMTWGARHSHWSGSALMCDYAAQFNGCIWQGGFNVSALGLGASAATIFPGWGASENDFMAGLSHYRGLWTYTAGLVYLGRASTDNPTQWGQSNSAWVGNLGLYRKMPEWMRNLSLYGGLGMIHFGRLGPAPIGMPSNTAFAGVDPRLNRNGYSLTLGALVTF